MKKTFPLLLAVIIPNIGYAKEWNFDVYLDKTRIGQHTFRLSEGNELISQAKFNVKVLFINAYKYNHNTVEHWKDGCLKSLESSTLENNISTRVKGESSDGEFVVNDGKAKQVLPGCPMTFAYWNQKVLEQTKLLNPQNAEWLDTRIVRIGSEMLDVKGNKVEALRYKLDASLAGKPKLNIDLWYRADNQEWVALKSITPEGYTINYKLR
ncbi:DUF6134 family protein [Methylotenera sp.]|uniref:DUF6134 family protein n=1 Tax=Methylotenera sp. TaxID=2051956 RepID=UPI002725F569|nr:DUF6134 family protein [Methylotenera sp.]MDO9205916.1 DUF6134 family protein [Methylotenera sp.]MDP2071587.1 DUF6134 family protein [Methylotenera sp.]MDP2229353.1 DUF6134 family protein [Methylotenera sp.]MDP3006677.1 DUF6134 family protein [Methylotenera sp.]MDP3141467.1 DUF6134 family protein [Methylotenera sp.]